MDDVPLLLFLLVLSGLFSGAEIALFSLGPEKLTALKNLTDSKSELSRIARLESLKANPQKLLVTILIGNNVVNVGSAALATIVATNYARENGFADNETMVVAIVTAVMTFLILLFGEITPKSLAHKYAVKFSLFITPALSFLQFILAPIVIPLTSIVKKFSGKEETSHGLTEEELKAALELSEQEGKIEHSEKEWVEKILEFGEHTVENVMTARSKIFALEDSTSIFEAIQEIQETKFSRIPIYHEDLDEVTGILSVHGILEKILDKDIKKLKVANLPLNKTLKIPVTMKIDTLLHTFQDENTHMALVYDEHGGLLGLITMEDVLEEIFGEIQDETDHETLEIYQSGKHSFIASSEVEIEQLEDFMKEKLEEEFPEKLPWDLEDENKSIGLFLLEKLEKFPTKGEKVKLIKRGKKFVFEIIECEEEQILKVEFKIN